MYVMLSIGLSIPYVCCVSNPLLEMSLEDEAPQSSPGVWDDASSEDGSKLRAYYARYNISLDDLQANETEPYRYIRLHPAFDANETLHQLKAELALSERSLYPIAVPWLDPAFRFYALPGDFRLAQSPSFQSARIYGQDVSSGAAVAALLSDYHHRDQKQSERESSLPSTTRNWRVLDLCCAPGLKMCAIADWLRQQQAMHNNSPSSSDSNPVVVGVDISEQRLAACRKIVQKHQIEPFAKPHSLTKLPKDLPLPIGDGVVRIRIYHNDGTKFGTEPTKLFFDSKIAIEEQREHAKRKRLNKSARARQKKKLKEVSMENVQQNPTGSEKKGQNLGVEQFDRVLVDAECSTDGSLKHIKKRIAKSRADDARASSKEPLLFAIPRLTSEQQLAELVDLQRGLAETGFLLLKKGGSMVYSTCSLSVEQNEKVVQWLLEKYSSEARIVPLKFADSGQESLIKEGSVPGTVRFFPNSCRQNNQSSIQLSGGGFFLAKIKKLV